MYELQHGLPVNLGDSAAPSPADWKVVHPDGQDVCQSLGTTHDA